MLTTNTLSKSLYTIDLVAWSNKRSDETSELILTESINKSYLTELKDKYKLINVFPNQSESELKEIRNVSCIVNRIPSSRDRKEIEEEWDSAVDSIIKNDDIEFLEYCRLEDFLEKTIIVFGDNDIGQSLIRKYFLKNFKYDYKLISVLHAVSHLDYKLVSDSGPFMASMCLNHKNLEVREFALKAFENWQSKDTLDFLHNISFEQQWMQEYLVKIIRYIEDDEQ